MQIEQKTFALAKSTQDLKPFPYHPRGGSKQNGIVANDYVLAKLLSFDVKKIGM